MGEVIVFPDAEQLVAGYLSSQLDGRPVGTRVPNPRPDRFHVVKRTGGPRATLVTDAAQLTVESWSIVESQAATDAQMARALILALPGETLDGQQVIAVTEFSGPANLPDPASGQPRYSQTLAVHLRGTTS